MTSSQDLPICVHGHAWKGVCRFSSAHHVLAEVVGVKGGCPYEPQHVQASVYE